MYKKMDEIEKNLLDFYNKLLSESRPMPEEFARIVEEHFDELID